MLLLTTIAQMAPAPKVPLVAPSWTVNFIIQGALCNFFGEMKRVAQRMARDDQTCEHYQHITRGSFAHVKRWYENMMAPSD